MLNKEVPTHILLILTGVAIIVAAGLAYIIAPTLGNKKISNEHPQDTIRYNFPTNDTAPNVKSPSGDSTAPQTLCAEVITPAQNEVTGQVRDFPSPCQIPQGWKAVQR